MKYKVEVGDDTGTSIVEVNASSDDEALEKAMSEWPLFYGTVSAVILSKGKEWDNGL